jgi:hypothetical protein
MKMKAGPGSCLIIVLGAIILLVLLVYLCIPYAPKTTADLCGLYILDCDLEHEELTLNSDGTFTQILTVKDTSEVFSSKGKWTYARDSWCGLSCGTVTFIGGMRGVLERPDKLKANYAEQKPGGGGVSAQYWFGQLTLGGADSWPAWKKAK